MRLEFLDTLRGHEYLQSQDVNIGLQVVLQFDAFIKEINHDVKNNERLTYEIVRNAFAELSRLKRLFVDKAQKTKELNFDLAFHYEQQTSFIDRAKVRLVEFMIMYYPNQMLKPASIKIVREILPKGNMWRDKFEFDAATQNPYRIENLLKPGFQISSSFFKGGKWIKEGKTANTDFIIMLYDNRAKLDCEMSPSYLYKVDMAHGVNINIYSIRRTLKSNE